MPRSTKLSHYGSMYYEAIETAAKTGSFRVRYPTKAKAESKRLDFHSFKTAVELHLQGTPPLEQSRQAQIVWQFFNGLRFFVEGPEFIIRKEDMDLEDPLIKALNERKRQGFQSTFGLPAPMSTNQPHALPDIDPDLPAEVQNVRDKLLSRWVDPGLKALEDLGYIKKEDNE